jgi:hypothetical protein
MKYKIKRVEKEESFRPFQILLTIETKEEYVNFHDNVMGKITPTSSHKFHGDVYTIGCGAVDAAEGTI